MCLELNAHAIVTYVLIIRDQWNGDCNFFVPWLLGSQPCEKTFRTVRSMSTIFSTVLNFSILGLLWRLHWINIQLELQATLEGVVKFPSIERRITEASKCPVSDKSPLASIKDADIASAIDQARSKAKRALEALEMDKLLKMHSFWDKEYTLPDASVDDNEADDDDDKVEGEPDINNSPDSESSKLSVLAETCLDSPTLIESDLKNMSSQGKAHTSTQSITCR